MHCPQLPLQVITIIMRKGMGLGKRQPDPIPDRSMAEVVIEDRVPALRNTAEHPQVGVIAGIEQQPRLRLMEICQCPLRLVH